ncbi:nuclease [Pseudodesulfovibrio sp. F-1]|uniref:Nuclease n=1 Tax=Pseudodesulfovibrio alkaliphilus TaxID=2661613 RepID=A0A7K1KMD5_9BACT|nr:thermonuclease family protein [Pseudodesulfovibrio alkaliphilus]MUM77235.1 nuclease [Pseudodesulfovibrio alkaliphilus]
MLVRNPRVSGHVGRISTQTALAILVLALLCSCARAEAVRLVRVIDGDSLLVELAGRREEVRLIGIDAPEGRQEFGARSRGHVAELCRGQTLRLEFDTQRRDRYGRLLAYLFAGELMVNEELVRSGLALALPVRPNTAHAGRLARAEAEAREAGRGFWVQGGLKLTPAQWRKRHGR